MRKRVLLFVLSAFTAIATWAAGEHSTLVVELKDGSTLNYMLTQDPRVTLKHDTLVISVHEVSYPDPANPTPESGAMSPDATILTYLVGSVKNFRFKMYDPSTGIKGVKEDDKSIVWIKQMDGQTLTISGTEADDRINIYTVDGRMVQGALSSDEGETILSIGSLEKGIYIIQVSNKISFKILKQ